MKIIERYYSLLAATIVFIVYLFTLAPTIIHLDAGELTAIQSTLGIAHPTGYPLFTLTGYLVSKLFFFVNTVYLLNILAAVYCSLAVFFLTKLVRLALENLDELKTQKKKSRQEKKLNTFQKSTISLTVGLIIGLSKTFWFQSTSVEVYSLHLFLISLILFFTGKAFFTDEVKNWYFVAVFLALGFSNHMTTILLIPGIAFLFFKQNGIKKESLITIGKMLLLFIPLLLILYSYLPITALQEPTINWGNPIDLEKFLRHVSGKQYQVWIFSSIDAAKKQLVYFIENLPGELGYVALFTSLIGIPFTIKRTKVLSIFFVVNFLSTLLYSINYDIADIDSYFLLAFISLALFSLGFLIELIHRIPENFSLSFLIVPVILILVNFSTVNQSDKYAFEDYTKAMLDNTEKNSIILSYLWDYFISPSYYFQYVEGYRSDVAIIDKELLRRSWYYNQLNNNMHGVIQNVEAEYKSFLNALEPFERDEPFNADFIERNYQQLMTGLISKNVNEREFYITPELVEKEIKNGELKLPTGYTLVPMELAFKVVQNSAEYILADPTTIKIRFSSNPNHYEKTMKNLCVNMMIYRIYYELEYNKKEKAAQILDYLKHNYPGYRIPPVILEKLGS